MIPDDDTTPPNMDEHGLVFLPGTWPVEGDA